MAPSVKRQLPQLLSGITSITPEVFARLLEQTSATPAYLRRLLRQLDSPLHPLVEGVRQDSLTHLVRTLTSLAELYPDHPQSTRRLVLESKQHTRLILARTPADPWRQLVLLHLNTWLENPDVYPVWARLQSKAAASP